MLWVYPAAIYILVVLNGLTAFWLAREWKRQPGDTRFRRWLAANLMAAIPTTQMMLPLVPQLLNHLRTAPEARQPLKVSWLIETSSNLLVGASWNKSGSLNSPYVELATRSTEPPVVFVSLLAVLGLAAIAGILRLTRWKWPQGAIVAFTLLIPTVIEADVAKATNQWLFEWYLIYLLPGLIAVVSVGVCGEPHGAFKLPWRIVAATGLLLGLRGLFRARPQAYLSAAAGSDQGSRDVHERHLEACRRVRKRALDSEFSRPFVVIRHARATSQDSCGSTGGDAKLRPGG